MLFLRLAFAKTVFHKIAILLIFYTEYTKNVLEILSYPESYKGPHGWARRKILKLKVLRRLENAILRLVSANTVNVSFNYIFFQVVYKHYIVFKTLQTLPDLDNILTQFYLNFLKLQKLKELHPHNPQSLSPWVLVASSRMPLS